MNLSDEDQGQLRQRVVSSLPEIPMHDGFPAAGRGGAVHVQCGGSTVLVQSEGFHAEETLYFWEYTVSAHDRESETKMAEGARLKN